jgi:hypothetical protein
VFGFIVGGVLKVFVFQPAVDETDTEELTPFVTICPVLSTMQAFAFLVPLVLLPYHETRVTVAAAAPEVNLPPDITLADTLVYEEPL